MKFIALLIPITLLSYKLSIANEPSINTSIIINLGTLGKASDSLLLDIHLFDSFLGSGYKLFQSFSVFANDGSINLILPEIAIGSINIRNKDKVISSSGSVIFNGETLFVEPDTFKEVLNVRGGENEFMQENFTLPFNLPSLITNNRSFKDKMVQRSYDLQIPENPRLQAIYSEYLKNVVAMVSQNPKSYHLLRKLNDNSSNITLKALDTALSIFNEKIVNTEQGRKLKTFIANGKWLINKPNLNIVLLEDGKGQKYPLEKLMDTTRYTLIDFWASWCVPCRQFNASLVQNYASIDKSKVQIISISLDEDIQKWKTAIEKDKLSWINLIDPSFKGFNGDLAKLFNILFIPQSFLFDKNGNIVQMNISLEELIEISK